MKGNYEGRNDRIDEAIIGSEYNIFIIRLFHTLRFQIIVLWSND